MGGPEGGGGADTVFRVSQKSLPLHGIELPLLETKPRLSGRLVCYAVTILRATQPNASTGLFGL
jgi:hypothetical protein